VAKGVLTPFATLEHSRQLKRLFSLGEKVARSVG